MRVLSLDAGTSSAGFALIEISADGSEGRVIHAGVRIFPEGVDRDQQGGEKSKQQSRREARGIRRQIARKNQRRRRIKYAIQSKCLLPTDRIELENVMKQSPYELRKKGLTEKLERYELGRVLYHFAVRRGFLSNRKSDASRDDKGILQEMGELEQELNNRGEALGQYLHAREANFDHRRSDKSERIRRIHTRRSMYVDEFNKLWAKQSEYHRDLLTETLKYGSVGIQIFPTLPARRRSGNDLLAEFGFYGLIFFQRKMYWPKSVVGQCELTDESQPDRRCRKKRCPKAFREAQKFRILQEVNNLKILDYKTERRLTDAEREVVVAALMTSKQQTFVNLRKKLNIPDNQSFNIERGGRDKLKGHETDSALSSTKAIGKAYKLLDDAIKDRIVEICVQEDRDDIVISRLMLECGLTDEQAKRAAKASLPDGYMSFCHEAIRRLNKYLERGLFLMADDAENSALHAAGYLRPDQRVVNVQEELPAAPDLPNPIVRRAMTEIRKIVNNVIRTYGKPDRIHIELAREAKKSFDERQEIRLENYRRERLRTEIANRIQEHHPGIKPTRNTVNRYLLWEEQGHNCLYCGEKIALSQLFSGDVDVDHILPRWRSLDDSMGNKLVCHRRCNEKKKDRTPREWLEAENPTGYEKLLQMARLLSYQKQQKLRQLDIRLDDFVDRQLRDTSYIARRVKEYLECLGVPIICPRGGMTKDLRHWWGLNNILDPEQRGKKNRGDHRHHAVDAIVIALTDFTRLHALANARGENMPAPWPGFLHEARLAVLNINVSHRVQKGISGALHEATIYGATQKDNQTDDVTRSWAKEWIEDPKTFVRRKSVDELKNAKHLLKVRDRAIRDTLAAHLAAQGVDPFGKKAYPSDAFKGSNTPRMNSGVPIRRVRMLEVSETFKQVSNRRFSQFVKPGNNHHIIYWTEGNGRDERWSADVVTMWEAAKRAVQGLQLIDREARKGKRFVMSLSMGEMFQIAGEKQDILLCVVRKIDQRSKRVYYKLHNDAREADEINKDNLYLSPKAMQERVARKVTVDPLGRIRWARD